MEVALLELGIEKSVYLSVCLSIKGVTFVF